LELISDFRCCSQESTRNKPVSLTTCTIWCSHNTTVDGSA